MLGPSPFEARPTMVISFELFMLRSRQVTYDKCVAHGMFPLMNSDFEFVEGKFKVPMIRGEIDLSLDRFTDLEAVYANDIDNWMCNLYFSMRRIPTSQDEKFALDLFPIYGDADVTITEEDPDPEVHDLDSNGGLSVSVSMSLASEARLKDVVEPMSLENTVIDEIAEAQDAGKPGKREKYRDKIQEDIPIVYKTLETPEDYEEYRFSVTAADGLKSRSMAWNKLKYIMTEINADLGFRTIKNAEFWVTFLILCM